MKLSIRVDDSSEEMRVHFKQDDDGIVTTVFDLRVYRRCPFCGNPVEVKFSEKMMFRNANNFQFPYWVKTPSDCDKCRRTFATVVHIYEEEKE